MQTLIFLFFLFSIPAISQSLKPKDKRVIRRELKKMLETDQEFRSKIDPKGENNDSIWSLQSKNDSLNRNEFRNIITIYGYPPPTGE